MRPANAEATPDGGPQPQESRLPTATEVLLGEIYLVTVVAAIVGRLAPRVKGMAPRL
jgi:hypothetical protein